MAHRLNKLACNLLSLLYDARAYLRSPTSDEQVGLSLSFAQYGFTLLSKGVSRIVRITLLSSIEATMFHPRLQSIFVEYPLHRLPNTPVILLGRLNHAEDHTHDIASAGN
jgi:hypothetical protein